MKNAFLAAVAVAMHAHMTHAAGSLADPGTDSLADQALMSANTGGGEPLDLQAVIDADLEAALPPRWMEIGAGAIALVVTLFGSIGRGQGWF